MSGIMHTIDQRTQLAGRNRMELLLFKLKGAQRFGINVFKVREVIPKPKLIKMPKAHPVIKGVAHIRGATVAVLDLSLATKGVPLEEELATSVIITEYNRTVQGFLVAGVDRIVNMNWKDVLPPPKGAIGSYLTAVAKVEGEMVQIIDVEKILSEISVAGGVDPDKETEGLQAEVGAEEFHVLIVDDSVVARNQIKRTLEKVGVQLTVCKDGEEAYETLKGWADDPVNSPLKRLVVVVSDIEMPRMDGYTLTTAIRNDERLKHLHVLLHTSLSGVFNKDMVQRVGADDFLAKFQPSELAQRVAHQIRQAGGIVDVDESLTS